MDNTRNDKAYSIPELSISREIPLYALYLSAGTFYDTAIIVMQYPFFLITDHFQPLGGLFP